MHTTRTPIPPRGFFESLAARDVTAAEKATAERCTASPSVHPTPNAYESVKVHGLDISLDHDAAKQSIGIAIYAEDLWLDPYQALEIAFALQRYANKSILRSAQAIEARASTPVADADLVEAMRQAVAFTQTIPTTTQATPCKGHP